MSNPFVPDLAVIRGIKEEAPNVRTLTVSYKEKRGFDPQPGQFIELSILGYGEFPVSVSGVIDAEAGIFQTTVRRMGGVTDRIDDLKVSSTVGIRGPLGKGYPLQQMVGKDVVLIAGGVGIASIKHLAECLLKQRERYGRIVLLYGAQTPTDLIYKDEPLFASREADGRQLDVFITVDRPEVGWNGNVGLVLGLLDNVEPLPDKNKSVVAACGPSKMMKAVGARFTAAGFAGEQLLMSLERRMQCGLGMCGHCMIGHKRVCLDGPVMSLHDARETLEGVF